MILLKRIASRLRDYLFFETSSANQIKLFMKLARPHNTEHNLIRIGGNADGGYLIPDDLDGIEICFSPGVADTSNFELAMAQNGIKSYMADYSVAGPAVQNELFHFEKKYIGPTETDTHTTLENWVNRNAPSQTDFILQMDIEDSEYDVLASTPRSTLQKFRIMTIEFHRFRKLFNKNKLKKLHALFDKLLLDFEILHVHPNNHSRQITYRGLKIPLVMEYTFLRKDRIQTKTPATIFPHPLDHANIQNLPDRVLPECWYNF